MKVTIVSPTYFSDASQLGGGERYVDELSRALAHHTEVELVSFGKRPLVDRTQSSLTLRVYPARHLPRGNSANPVNLRFLRRLRDADVVHCAQPSSLVANLAVGCSRATGKPVAATDLGGGGVSLRRFARMDRWVDTFLSISQFAAQGLPVDRSRVIYGGVNTTQFSRRGGPREPYFLFVGRVLPHKGINYLVDALPQGARLKVVGRRSDVTFAEFLAERARGKAVEFLEVPVNSSASGDATLAELYSRATATILPSVYVDVHGRRTEVPELLGLTLLESMACNTPVICTSVGGMPEVVEDGANGFVVPPNDVSALRGALQYYIDNPGEVERMGRTGWARVHRDFTWDAVALRCLEAYQDALGDRT